MSFAVQGTGASLSFEWVQGGKGEKEGRGGARDEIALFSRPLSPALPLAIDRAVSADQSGLQTTLALVRPTTTTRFPLLPLLPPPTRPDSLPTFTLRPPPTPAPLTQTPTRTRL